MAENTGRIVIRTALRKEKNIYNITQIIQSISSITSTHPLNSCRKYRSSCRQYDINKGKKYIKYKDCSYDLLY